MVTQPRTPRFDISTLIEPEFTFLVDGIEYEMKRVVQLSKEEETELNILIRRENHYRGKFFEVVPVPNNERAMKEAYSNLWDCRQRLIMLMTNVPEDIAQTIRMDGQNKIIGAMGEMVVAARGGTGPVDLVKRMAVDGLLTDELKAELRAVLEAA